MTQYSSPLIVAVDGGGSTCRVAITNSDGLVISQAQGGGANITSDFESAVKTIKNTINEAYHVAGIDVKNQPNDFVYLGLAGGKTPGLTEKLEQNLGFFEYELVSDRKIMLQGAMGTDDGTVVATGTGSFFVHRINDQIHKVGGWGLNLGDEASGAYIGRKLLQETLHAHDGVIKHSPLTLETFSKFGSSPREMINFAKIATPNDYGKFSIQIVNALGQGDPVAASIMNDAIEDIVRVLDHWNVQASGALYMLGGLGHIYENLLPVNYRSLVKSPKNNALHGGIQLAIKKWFT